MASSWGEGAGSDIPHVGYDLTPYAQALHAFSTDIKRTAALYDTGIIGEVSAIERLRVIGQDISEAVLSLSCYEPHFRSCDDCSKASNGLNMDTLRTQTHRVFDAYHTLVERVGEKRAETIEQDKLRVIRMEILS